MLAMRFNDAGLMTDGYERLLSIEGRGDFLLRAGETKLIRHPKGSIETGRIAFEDGSQHWVVFVDTNDGFDVYGFLPATVGNDLQPFDLRRGYCGQGKWSADKCRYRRDGRPLHERSANDIDQTGWSIRTLAQDARPDGQKTDSIAIDPIVSLLSKGLEEGPSGRRALAGRLRAAAAAMSAQADLLD